MGEMKTCRQPNDGRQEAVANDGGNGGHMLVYKTQTQYGFQTALLVSIRL